MTQFERPTRRGTFRIGTAFFVHQEPGVEESFEQSCVASKELKQCYPQLCLIQQPVCFRCDL